MHAGTPTITPIYVLGVHGLFLLIMFHNHGAKFEPFFLLAKFFAWTDFFYTSLTLLLTSSGMTDVITRGGAIMARMDSNHPEAVSRHSRAQN